MATSNDPDLRGLPIKLDSTSNGEFAPVPLDAADRHARNLARESIHDAARRLGQARRRYLVSLLGAAAALGAFNRVFAAAGRGVATAGLHDHGQAVRAVIGRLLGADSGTELSVALECDDVETMKDVALACDSVLAAPHAAVEQEVAAGTLHPLSVAGPPVSRHGRGHLTGSHAVADG